MAWIRPLWPRMDEGHEGRQSVAGEEPSLPNRVSKVRRYFSRSPDRLGLEDVHAFQVHLVATGISWPALNQTVCALRFFYGVTLGQDTVPERLPYARHPSQLPGGLAADAPVRFLPPIPT